MCTRFHYFTCARETTVEETVGFIMCSMGIDEILWPVNSSRPVRSANMKISKLKEK
jgi:hypothetical protein